MWEYLARTAIAAGFLLMAVGGATLVDSLHGAAPAPWVGGVTLLAGFVLAWAGALYLDRDDLRTLCKRRRRD